MQKNGADDAENGEKLLLAAAWLAAAVFTALETLFLYEYVTMSRYVAQWGAAENPRAAEDAWAAGLFSLGLLPFALWTVIAAIQITRKIKKEKQEVTIHDNAMV